MLIFDLGPCATLPLVPTYSLFIERPRTGAAPVPYGPFLKTKSLAEVEAWVAAPVLSAKAAANVREGDLFTARYPDTKLRNEHGPISRVAAFGRVTAAGVDVFTAEGGPGALAKEWMESKDGARLLRLATNVPRQLLVFTACQVARKALKYVMPKTEKRPENAIVMAEAWARGKKTLEDVKVTASAANAASAHYAAANAAAAAAAYAAAHAANAADAAYAASAADNASAAARTASLLASALLVRKYITLPEVCFYKVLQ